MARQINSINVQVKKALSLVTGTWELLLRAKDALAEVRNAVAARSTPAAPVGAAGTLSKAAALDDLSLVAGAQTLAPAPTAPWASEPWSHGRATVGRAAAPPWLASRGSLAPGSLSC